MYYFLQKTAIFIFSTFQCVLFCYILPKVWGFMILTQKYGNLMVYIW